MRLLNSPPSSSLLAAFALALGACGDATGPKTSVSVSVDVERIDGPTYSENAAHEPQVGCRVYLRAVATGEGQAIWKSATLRFYIGPDHGILVDTVTYEAVEIGRSWSQDGGIGAGQVQETYWDISAAIPFYVTIDYRYQPPNRGVQTATVSFACGAPVVTNAPPPAVTALTITPPSGELPAGAPITVTYTVQAPAGLWRTDVVVETGSCESHVTIAEHLQTSATRTVVVPIAGSCPLGVPIRVTVYAFDALAQEGERTLVSSIVLADRQAPTIFPWFYEPNGSPGVWTFHGDLFGGDSIKVALNASDNHGLSVLIWEVLPFGVRDSVFVSGLSAYNPVWIHLRPEWSGPFQLRFTARDLVGLTSPALTTPEDRSWVHPTIQRPTRTATVPGETQALAVDSRRGQIWLAQGNDHRLAAVSMATSQVTATVALPGVPTDLDITPGGDSLLVVISGQRALGVVDLRDVTPTLSMLPLPWLDEATSQLPFNVRAAANGRAYLTLRGSTATALRMVELNLADGAVRTLAGAGDNGNIGVGILERSLDGSVLVVNAGDPRCFQRYDVMTDVFSACVQPRYYALRPTVDRTGSRIALGYDIYDESLQLLPKLKGDFTFYPSSDALSADGAVLLVSTPLNGLVRLRTSDSEILDRTPNPVGPGLMRVSPDGAFLVSIAATDPLRRTLITVIDLR